MSLTGKFYRETAIYCHEYSHGNICNIYCGKGRAHDRHFFGTKAALLRAVLNVGRVQLEETGKRLDAAGKWLPG